MSGDQARLKLLVNQCRYSIPGFQIRYKNELFWQRVIAFLMFWNRRYLKDYITTLYPKVYWPNKENFSSNNRTSLEILAHEFVHLLDAKNRHGWFGFSYISVQIWSVVSVFALLSIWFSLWFLLFLLGLIFLAPWPSPWRTKWELRGYAMTMAIEYWEHEHIRGESKRAIVQELCGSMYYFSCWSREKMWEKLREIEDDIISGKVLEYGKAFQSVKGIVTASDRQVIAAAEANLVAPIDD